MLFIRRLVASSFRSIDDPCNNQRRCPDEEPTRDVRQRFDQGWKEYPEGETQYGCDHKGEHDGVQTSFHNFHGHFQLFSLI